MKITDNDYTRLQALITSTVQDYNIKPLSDYPATNKMRYMWDIYHTTVDRAQHANNVSDYLFLRHLYDYLNDDHLTTALRSILSHMGKF